MLQRFNAKWEKELFYSQVHSLIDKYDLDNYDNEYKGVVDEFEEFIDPDKSVKWRIYKTYFPPLNSEGGFAEYVFTKYINIKKKTKMFKVWIYPKIMSNGDTFRTNSNKNKVDNGNWISDV